MFGAAGKSIYKIPGRKCLDEVVKLSLLEQATTPEVMNIWTSHHVQMLQYWGRVISTPAYDALRPRLDESPYFIFPVFRDKGLFNVVTNFDKDLIGVAPLGEFQKRQDHTETHMTIQFFTELSRTKNLVLVRCEIQDKVFVRSDCIFITQMLLKYYTQPDLYSRFVHPFNKNPNQFDYHNYLKHMRDDAGKKNIDILDKKSGMRADAYAPKIETPTPKMAEAILKSKTKSE
jgi:hypothetical protein